MTVPSDHSERFVQLLIDDGLIRRDDWQIAQSIHKVQGGRLIEILLGLCPISEEELYQATARQLNMTFWSEHQLANLSLPADLLQKFPANIVLEHNFLPIKWEGGGAQRTLHLVIPNPLEHETLEAIRLYGQAAYLQLGVATPSSIVNAIQVHYKNRMPSFQEKDGEQSGAGVAVPASGLSTGVHVGIAPPKLQLKQCPACDTPQPVNADHCGQCGSPMDLSQADPVLGKTVGNFCLQSKLGEGGMGIVYRAFDERNRQEAAVKILRTHLTTNERVVKRFHREAQAQNLLRHENIVHVHDFGFEEGVGFFIAMEFLRGKSMEEILEKYPELLTVAFTGSVVRQVCDAMGFAHSRGIYHRDLKPDNIFLVDQGHWEPPLVPLVKVLDFGVAKMVASEEDERLTRTGMTIGTPRYMAPEQAGDGNADHRSDIYSLGVILFEILTGQSPFEGSSAYQIMLRHVYADPPSLRETRPDIPYPVELENFMQSSMAKDPRKRPHSMDMFWQTLAPGLQQLERDVGPMSSLHQKARGPFRRSQVPEEEPSETAEPPVIVGRMVHTSNPPAGPPGANIPTTMAPAVGESSHWGAAIQASRPSHNPGATAGHNPGAIATPPPGSTPSSGWLQAEDLAFWEDSFPEDASGSRGGSAHAQHENFMSMAPLPSQNRASFQPTPLSTGIPGNAFSLNPPPTPPPPSRSMQDVNAIPFPGFSDPAHAPHVTPLPHNVVQRPSLLSPPETPPPVGDSIQAIPPSSGAKPTRSSGLNLRADARSIREKNRAVQPRALKKQHAPTTEKSSSKTMIWIILSVVLVLTGIGVWFFLTQMK